MIKLSLSWGRNYPGFVANITSKPFPGSYFRVWREGVLWRAKCVHVDYPSVMLGHFHTRKEAAARCLDYITPKSSPYAHLYMKSSGGEGKTWKRPEKKNKRIRLLFDT